jgi:hypothetical protein
VQRPVIVERPIVTTGTGAAAGGTPRVSVNNTTFLPLEKVPLKEGAVPETGFEDMVLPFFMIAFIFTAAYAARATRRFAF